VKAIFADTFCWVALTNPADARYQDASAVDDILAGSTVFTTDEVLAEFLTFFANDAWMRNRAAETVLELLKEPDVCVVAQRRILSRGSRTIPSTSGQELKA